MFRLGANHFITSAKLCVRNVYAPTADTAIMCKEVLEDWNHVTSLAGLESYLTYDHQSAGLAGTGSVSLVNGNLIFSHADTAMNGNRLPVTATRTSSAWAAAGGIRCTRRCIRCGRQ